MRPETTRKTKHGLPGQVVLVLQGGGALGAYQVGVYQALHEAGIEPDWVIGTSIGAINAALICGNEPQHRLARLDAFWSQVERKGFGAEPARPVWPGRHARHDEHRAARHSLVLRAQPRRLARNLGRKQRRAGVVLQHRAAARDAAGPGRLALPVRVPDPAHGRRRQRLQRRDALLRHPRGKARRRARDGLGRAAAGVRCGAHRRPALLGRRHLLEHADRGGARRQAAPRFAHLRRQRLAPDRERAELDPGGDGADQRTSSSRAAPTATSRARSRSTTCATSSAS